MGVSLASSRSVLADEGTVPPAAPARMTQAPAHRIPCRWVPRRWWYGRMQTGQEITVAFAHAAEAGLPAHEGECSLRDRPLAAEEPTTMTFDSGPLTGAELMALTLRPNLFGVVATANSNTFEIVAVEALTEPALTVAAADAQAAPVIGAGDHGPARRRRCARA